VTLFLLTHHHEPADCGPAFAAWKGFDSPLRGLPTVASCISGGHHAWWRVDAPDAAAALAQLPQFVAARTEVEAVREVMLP
jgi:hypothetical protein